MTVSTVGVVPVIRELASSGLKVRLAVSVVAADERLRDLWADRPEEMR
jgi:adenine C2-methylase RlmN of 23S rRNA A2503 and tRNA A37